MPTRKLKQVSLATAAPPKPGLSTPLPLLLVNGWSLPSPPFSALTVRGCPPPEAAPAARPSALCSELASLALVPPPLTSGDRTKRRKMRYILSMGRDYSSRHPWRRVGNAAKYATHMYNMSCGKSESSGSVKHGNDFLRSLAFSVAHCTRPAGSLLCLLYRGLSRCVRKKTRTQQSDRHSRYHSLGRLWVHGFWTGPDLDSTPPLPPPPKKMA